MMTLLGLRERMNPLPVFRPEAAKNIKIKDARVGSDAPAAAGNAQTKVFGAPGTHRQEQMNDLPSGDEALRDDPSGPVLNLQRERTAFHSWTRLQFQTQDVAWTGRNVDSDSCIITDPAGYDTLVDFGSVPAAAKAEPHVCRGNIL